MVLAEAYTYFGTSDFGAAILAGLIGQGCKPSLVVTTVGRPRGRGLRSAPTLVAEVAKQAALPLLEVSSLQVEQAQHRLAAEATPFAVLAAFGMIIPWSALQLYPKCIVNVHPSLLPRYRGASPISAALLDGAAETGTSIMLLDAEVDHGPVLSQARLAVSPGDDAVSLSGRLAQVSLSLLGETLEPYLGGTLLPKPQDHARATYTRLLSRGDGKADFAKPAHELDRIRRAFTPWPGLWTSWQGKRLKLITATPRLERASGVPGSVQMHGPALVVTCGSGCLELREVQLEGAQPTPAADFARGHPTILGQMLPS